MVGAVIVDTCTIVKAELGRKVAGNRREQAC